MEPDQPPPPILQQFLLQDFGYSCEPDHYCFICNRAFCSHCCDGQHSLIHHPHQRPAAARVMRIGQDWAVYAEDIKGTGYDWSRIQRFKHQGRKFILINRKRNPPDHNMPLACSHCNDAMRSQALYCCAACKVLLIVNANNHDMMNILITTNFIEGHQVDTFCMTCRRTYSHMSCPEHVTTHHGNADVEGLIPIVRHEAWVLTPREHGLPEHVVNNVQAIVVSGVSMVPVFRREEPADGEPGGFCVSCYQITLGDADYCCLHCKNVVLANA